MLSKAQLSGACVVLAAIASIMLQHSMNYRHAVSSAEWIHLINVAALAFVIFKNTPWQEKSKTSLTLVSVCFLALTVMPFFYNNLQRATDMGGYLYDIQIILLLRNLMIGLVFVRSGEREYKIAALASCFIVLFSTLWLMDRLIVLLLFSYTIVGMWWLMGSYWEKISCVFLSGSERYIPWKPLGAASGIGIISLLAIIPLTTGINVTTAVDGFMPSSGGTKWQDKYAQGGVGDGPQMIRAKKNASTFGPVESELFLESKMPSLYDVFNDMYGEPPKPSRKRAIPLSPTVMQENHKKLGSNLKSSREFSVVRRGKEKAPESSGSKSPSLIQIAGRVPLHLGLYAYDLWDGTSLSSSNSAQDRALYLDKSSKDERAWARYVSSSRDAVLSHPDRHEIRIINLKTERVPSPPNLEAVHIDKLHTESFFKTKEDGMLSMDMDFIPQLTVLHVESLQRSYWDTPRLISSSSKEELDGASRIRELAQQWTSNLEEPWQKIEEICRRLRSEYTLDAEYITPEEIEDAAIHFLFESKRGPDHHFAVSAALLIRSLGFESRVISGLYADPKNYDRQSKLTMVYTEDAHFWVEVLGDTGNSFRSEQTYWLALDPSPGYQILLAPESLWSRMMIHAVYAMEALKRNPIPTFIVLAIICFLMIQRAVVGDLLATTWWELHHRLGDRRHQIISTLRLLKRRAYLHGISNPKGTPLSRWNLTFSSNQNLKPDPLATSFKDLANWALYGEGVPLEYGQQEIDSLCRHAAVAGYPSLRKSNAQTNKLSKQEIE